MWKLQKNNFARWGREKEKKEQEERNEGEMEAKGDKGQIKNTQQSRLIRCVCSVMTCSCCSYSDRKEWNKENKRQQMHFIRLSASLQNLPNVCAVTANREAVRNSLHLFYIKWWRGGCKKWLCQENKKNQQQREQEEGQHHSFAVSPLLVGSFYFCLLLWSTAVSGGLSFYTEAMPHWLKSNGSTNKASWEVTSASGCIHWTLGQ